MREPRTQRGVFQRLAADVELEAAADEQLHRLTADRGGARAAVARAEPPKPAPTAARQVPRAVDASGAKRPLGGPALDTSSGRV